MLAVHGHEGHLAGACPGSQDDVVGLILGALHVEASGGDEASEPGDQVDLVLAQQELHAL